MKYLVTFIVLLTTYLLLASFHIHDILLGSIVSAFLTTIVVKFVDFDIDATLPLKLVKFILIYMPVFIWKLVLANFDVAKLVLSPKINLNSAIVKVETKFEGDFAKLILANSITLTPGTLSIDIEDDAIYVHVMNVKGENKAEIQKEISGDFEKILRGVFK